MFKIKEYNELYSDFQSSDSSVIESYYYDDFMNTLIINFKDGGKYLYSGVPRSVYDRFINHESHGSFIFHNLKGYPYKKIE
jgi:hypothetical protein